MLLLGRPLRLRQAAALWDRLAWVTAVDLTIARVIEPHVDALAILRLGIVQRITSNYLSSGMFSLHEGLGARLTVTREGDG